MSIHETALLHVALMQKTREHAEEFFGSILNLACTKEFVLSKDLSDQVFGRNEAVEVMVFGNEKCMFEVFIVENAPVPVMMQHVCVDVGDKDLFLKRCENKGLLPFKVKKGEKTLLFVRDKAANLYEIK